LTKSPVRRSDIPRLAHSSAVSLRCSPKMNTNFSTAVACACCACFPLSDNHHHLCSIYNRLHIPALDGLLCPQILPRKTTRHLPHATCTTSVAMHNLCKSRSSVGGISLHFTASLSGATSYGPANDNLSISVRMVSACGCSTNTSTSPHSFCANTMRSMSSCGASRERATLSCAVYGVGVFLAAQ